MEKQFDFKNINLAKITNSQEIRLWILIPAIKKEMATYLVNEKSVSQKKIAEILNLTPAAISQYVNDKRANIVNFNEDIRNKIYESANKIYEKKSLAKIEIANLLYYDEIKKLVCKIHKSIDPDFKNCSIEY
ncbi:MAG: hypothetical protein PHT94_02160 [Candidatus Nanoarchaeia archaeon]|nr:hypothetical protein [Candidatus Nanoarchaeia archaeon]